MSAVGEFTTTCQQNDEVRSGGASFAIYFSSSTENIKTVMPEICLMRYNIRTTRASRLRGVINELYHYD